MDAKIKKAAAEMRTPWTLRKSTTLSDVYDADLAAVHPLIRELRRTKMIPHPLLNVQYADGVLRRKEIS